MRDKMAVIEHVREEIRSRGPLASRDFAGRQRISGGFSTVKDSSLALYLLWLSGELVTHSRRGFDRVYDLGENHAGREATEECATDAEAQEYFARKAFRDLGLATGAEWSRRVRVYLHRLPDVSPSRTIDTLSAQGFLIPVETGGGDPVRWALAEDADRLTALDAGVVPADWTPLAESTEQEAVFLAPLDNVIWDRARTKALFDFDYVWEVYKPAHLRRWGYYTLPILWGDKLVARFAPRLNRKSGTLVVEGFWLEDEALARNAAFRSALAAGMRRFCGFHEASAVEPGPMAPLLGARFGSSLCN
jgi:uncharacterized protein YcaQ